MYTHSDGSSEKSYKDLFTISDFNQSQAHNGENKDWLWSHFMQQAIPVLCNEPNSCSGEDPPTQLNLAACLDCNPNAALYIMDRDYCSRLHNLKVFSDDLWPCLSKRINKQALNWSHKWTNVLQSLQSTAFRWWEWTIQYYSLLSFSTLWNYVDTCIEWDIQIRRWPNQCVSGQIRW